jgi:hypothetical protein
MGRRRVTGSNSTSEKNLNQIMTTQPPQECRQRRRREYRFERFPFLIQTTFYGMPKTAMLSLRGDGVTQRARMEENVGIRYRE